MRKVKLICLCALLLLLLGGCADKHELEDNTFAVLLGIDAADDGNVIVTAAFPLTQLAGEGKGKAENEYSVLSVKARTVADGFQMFSTKLSGPLALFSVKTVVISQELAEQDVFGRVSSSWLDEKTKNTAAVLISNCKAYAFIGARVKNSPIDPLRQEELLLEQSNNNSYYKVVQFSDLLRDMRTDSANGVAIYGGIAEKAQAGEQGDAEQKGAEAKDAEQEDESGDNSIEEQVKSGYLPGEMPIKAENETQICGLAVFHGSSMIGALNSSEAQTYALLTKGKVQKTITVPDPVEPSGDIVALVSSKRSRIRAAMEDGAPVFDIDVRLRCAVESVQSGVDYTVPKNYGALTERIEKACQQEMEDLVGKIQKEYKADILELGDKLVHQFATQEAWERYDWERRYQNAQIRLHVQITVEKTEALAPKSV